MPACTVPGCTSTDTRLYISGPKCDPHSPWAVAGHPDPRTQIDPTRDAAALRANMLARLGDTPADVKAAVMDAHPDKAKTALDILRRAALHLELVSANDVRVDMETAKVPGQLRGPAFAAAVKAGYLEPVAAQASTDHGTHGKPVATYRSRLYIRKERQMSSCRSCHREIFWAGTKQGKRMPIDPEPNPAGNVAMFVDENTGRETAIVLTRDGETTNMPRYTSHFETCPDQLRRIA